MVEFFNNNSKTHIMSKKCKTCGKVMDHDAVTHCSNKCLFANLWDTESIGGTPIETWDESEKPWV